MGDLIFALLVIVPVSAVSTVVATLLAEAKEAERG